MISSSEMRSLKHGGVLMTKVFPSLNSLIWICAVMMLSPLVLAAGHDGELVAAQEAAAAESSTNETTFWKGPNGEALPFKNNEEIREFLRTAGIIDMEEVPEGINDPGLALLGKD